MLDKMLVEGLCRLKDLGFSSNIVESFQKGKVLMSSSDGELAPVNKAVHDMIDTFETEYNSKVYHVINNNEKHRGSIAMLYVSKHDSDWKADRSDIERGRVLTYIAKESKNWEPRFGTINIGTVMNSLETGSECGS